jgi:hypothetical protein
LSDAKLEWISAEEEGGGNKRSRPALLIAGDANRDISIESFLAGRYFSDVRAVA